MNKTDENAAKEAGSGYGSLKKKKRKKKSLQALGWSIRALISNEVLIRRFIYSNNN